MYQNERIFQQKPRHYEQNRPRHNFSNRISDEELLKWIPSDLKNVDFQELAGENGKIDKFTNKLKGLKSTQLRKFFDEIKKMQNRVDDRLNEEEVSELYLLIPKLKYAQARELCPQLFVKMMSKLIENTTKDEYDSETKAIAFKNMVKILEAVVAYHKCNNETKKR